MAKVVVQKVSPISFSSTPFVIYDHDLVDGVYYYKYRANIIINDAQEALRSSFEIRISRESPYTNRPNMFKNVSIGSSNDSVDTITRYDRTRLDVFKRKIDSIKKIPILLQDLRRGFVEFTMKNPGSQELFATITKNDMNVPLAGQVINFKNDPLVKIYAIPSTDFIVGNATVFRNKTRIAITPRDKRISKFEVRVSNTVDNKSVPDTQNQTLVTKVSEERIAYLDIVDTGDYKKNIKITPVSFYKNVGNTAYKEIILNEQLVYNDQCILYPIVDAGSSVIFSVNSVPDKVIAVKLLRKNLTKLHKNFTVVNSFPTSSKNFTIDDPLKQAYDTFIYKLEFEYTDGTRHQSSASYVLQPKLLAPIVKLNVRAVENDSGDLATSRKYLAEISYDNTTSTQSLLTDLKKLGIDNIFPNEIKNLSTQLDPLVGIIVKKINLVTCSEELIGLFKPGEIKVNYDDLTRAVLIFEVVVKPAVELIEDIASSRDFATVNIQGNIGDPMISARALGLTTFAKKDNFTQKFFNKSALYYGTLRYGKSLSSREAGIESGKTGIFQNIQLFPENVTPTLQFSGVITRLTDKIVSWKAENIGKVDRFDIFDNTDATRPVLLARSIADDNRLDFSVVIPTKVSKVTIQAILKNESETSIEANV